MSNLEPQWVASDVATVARYFRERQNAIAHGFREVNHQAELVASVFRRMEEARNSFVARLLRAHAAWQQIAQFFKSPQDRNREAAADDIAASYSPCYDLKWEDEGHPELGHRASPGYDCRWDDCE